VETFGYYGRFWLSQQPTNFKAYVLYDLLVLPAPIFLAATVYMSFSRIIVSLEADDLSAVRPKWMSRWFIVGDVVCFIVQLAGVGMGVTTSLDIQKIGAKVVVVGLVFQILVFALFIWAVVNFYRRYNAQVAGTVFLPWRRYLLSLLACSACIVVRNLVRGIEHAQGSRGYVITHEIFVYLFDALLMLCVAVLFLVFQPGRLRRSRDRKTSRDIEGSNMLSSSGEVMQETAEKGHRSRLCSYPRDRDSGADFSS
jgi:hypothetical protein